MDEKRAASEVAIVAGKVEAAAGDRTGDARAQVAAQAREAQGTVEILLGQAKDAATQAASHATEIAQEALQSGRERFPEAEQVYRRGNEAVRPYSQAAPLGIIVVAFGVGYLLSWLFQRRD